LLLTFVNYGREKFYNIGSRQFWTDPRLSFQRRPGLEKLVVGAEYINLIWVPDTFFVNEKTAYFHKATTENQVSMSKTFFLLCHFCCGEISAETSLPEAVFLVVCDPSMNEL
jgi:hypothetical protein